MERAWPSERGIVFGIGAGMVTIKSIVDNFCRYLLLFPCFDSIEPLMCVLSDLWQDYFSPECA